MKRCLYGLFICCYFLYNITVSVSADADAKAACVLDALTGRVLYEYNADVQLPMASTTKVMTALVALENAALTDSVTCGPYAFGTPGTSIYLGQGETLTMEEMLQGLLLASGNDAAVAIAEHVGGSVQGFAAMMNARAEALGARNTHFVNPHGLPAQQHYTTARDLATIAREAMRHPVFRQIVSTQRASIPWEGRDYNRQLRNKNRLLTDYSGATGIKTGYTRAAGRCLVFGAQREGMEVVGVVLGCPDWFGVSSRLMDEAFGAYQPLTLLAAGERVRSIPVDRGVYGDVDAVLRGPLYALLSEQEQPTVRIDLPDRLTAPLAADVPIGVAQLVGGGKILGEQPLYPAHDVPVRTLGNQLLRILDQWCLFSR